VPSFTDLTFGEAHRLIDKLESMPDHVAPPVPDPGAPLPQSTVDGIADAQNRAKAGGGWSHDGLARMGAALPPEGWTREQSDQLAADLLAELTDASTDEQRVQIAVRVGVEVKAGKITPADRETLLAAYKAAQPQRGRAKAGAAT
jgi:hypothetical protein